MCYHLDMIRNRTELELFESLVLAPYAVHSSRSRGRLHAETEAMDRLCFQRDRDRILHSRAWRRMKGKTQVFVAHHGDHYRTRLTHSLEVAQLSRDLARSLGLNEDLAECVALAHDLGHTPFGHAGEHALSECLQPLGLDFEHNQQSYRVVTEIERVYPDFLGLNLSVEVLEGMQKHETAWDHPKGVEGVRPSLEAQLVNLADEIAYQNHDVDDGLRSELFTEQDLAGVALWRKALQNIDDERIRQGRTVSAIIRLMVEDILSETERRLQAKGVRTLEDVYACAEPLVGFSEEMQAMNAELKQFLTSRLYFHPEVLQHSEHGQAVIRALFQILKESMEPLALRDYLSGMTDLFAEETLEIENL